MRKHEITRKFDEIVAFSGVERYVDTPVKRYSSGMYVRLAFAVAAHLESEILIVDEVLSVGDADFQKKCLGKMNDVSKGEGRTVLFVSHNMAAVKSLCNKGLLLENGIVVKNDNIESVISEYLIDNNISNRKHFINKHLVDIHVYQESNNLFIQSNYNSTKTLDIPNLGFVIYNHFGNPVIGGNPVISKSKIDTNSVFESGIITAKIINPRLVDGRYFMSVWFGDSKENHFEELECVSFEIKNMVGINFVNTSFIGSVAPEIEWNF
jgi:lipopolysaccharide transport system ATP-binding protein